MRRGSAAAGSARTWGLTLVFVLIIGAAITRTPVLWETSFGRLRPTASVFAQTYQMMRALYVGERGDELRIALLGNSRLMLAARGPSVQRELSAAQPGLHVRVEQMSVFGGGPVLLELASRHLHHLEPGLVVLAINGSDLRIPAAEQMEHPAYRLLNIGWADPPVPPESWSLRVDRWLRTVWRLWRFREFSRRALEERILRPEAPGLAPKRFTTTRSILAFARGEERADEIEAAYRRWQDEPTLERFVAYLEIGHRQHLQERMRRAKLGPDPANLERNLALLNATLARFKRSDWPTLVLLMAENPLLELDGKGRYHRLGSSDEEARLIHEVAVRYGVRFVDARRWMPAEAFVDFEHLWQDLAGFERPLAREIANVLGS